MMQARSSSKRSKNILLIRSLLNLRYWQGIIKLAYGQMKMPLHHGNGEKLYELRNRPINYIVMIVIMIY
jgi:hypothetical protein